jgi:hypothetical protein
MFNYTFFQKKKVLPFSCSNSWFSIPAAADDDDDDDGTLDDEDSFCLFRLLRLSS